MTPRFWSGPRRSLLARALAPFGALYGGTTARRMAWSGERVAAPVICVGNFVVGGSGKTPTAIALARMIQARGRRVFFLSRGYGGARRAAPVIVDPSAHDARAVGDEPLLLARVAPCVVGRDRVAAAHMAIESGAEVLVLDDGLQNPALAKDFSLAVVDGEFGFGNGLCFPAGPLRAPLAGQIAHVDAALVIGGDLVAAAAIGASVGARPLVRGRLEPEAIVASTLIGRAVLAFAGIARPAKFYATLERLGAQVVATHDFADHHFYAPREIEALLAQASQRGLTLVTTEKDKVRLAPVYAREVTALPITLRIERPETLAGLIDAAILRRG